MSINRVVQRGVWHATQHCRVHHCDDLAGFDAEHREAKNLIAVFVDQYLNKSASFGKCPGTQLTKLV